MGTPDGDPDLHPTADSAEPPVRIARHGLTNDDIRALERDREAGIDDLIATAPGRALVRRSDPMIHEAGLGIAADLEALGRHANVDDEDDGEEGGRDYLRRKSAAIVLNELAMHCHRLDASDLFAHRSVAYRFAQDVHMRMDDFIDRRFRSNRFVASMRGRRHIALHWGWVSNFFTFAAGAALLVGGHIGIAALLVGLRIFVTGSVWAMVSYPGDDSPTKPVLDSDPRMCVLGHSGDIVLYTAFGMTLINDQHMSTGVLVMAAGWIMILGTLMRLGASATGFPVPRLHLERMVRGGSTLAALWMSSVTAFPWWAAAIVVIAFPVVFAFIELQESLRAFAIGRRKPHFTPVAPAAGQIMEAPEVSVS